MRNNIMVSLEFEVLTYVSEAFDQKKKKTYVRQMSSIHSKLQVTHVHVRVLINQLVRPWTDELLKILVLTINYYKVSLSLNRK